jgi:hypothetical protein
MKTARRSLLLPLLGVAAALWGACSSQSTGSPDAGGTGGHGSGGSVGSGGTPQSGGVSGTGGSGEGGAAGAGASSAGGRAGEGGHGAGGGGMGGSSTVDSGVDATPPSAAGVCPGETAPNPDVATSCTLTNAKAGAACTQNCCLACGIDSLGEQTCTCTSHKYASCTCPLPPAWTALGGECGDSACLTVGGPCSPQGYASSAGAPQGATVLDGQPCVMNGNVCFTAETDGKHGCVCASDPSGDFVMRCGLVNGWFSNNGMATTY